MTGSLITGLYQASRILTDQKFAEFDLNKKDYDLIKLVIIRLGDKVYNVSWIIGPSLGSYYRDEGNEGYRLLRFLNAIMYPHAEDFMDTISEYIDFSANEDLWKETNGMFSLGQCILEDGKKEGMEKGMRALIMDNLEEHTPVERIIEKLQRYFYLSRESAQMYYEKFTQEE